MLGFKNNWLNEKVESVLEYYDIIKYLFNKSLGVSIQKHHSFFNFSSDAFQLEYGVCILRLEGGLDYSYLLEDLDANGK